MWVEDVVVDVEDVLETEVVEVVDEVLLVVVVMDEVLLDDDEVVCRVMVVLLTKEIPGARQRSNTHRRDGVVLWVIPEAAGFGT